MILELYLYASLLMLAALMVCAVLGHAVSGIAYPGSGAPLIPDGPVKRLLQVNVAVLAACAVLRGLGW